MNKKIILSIFIITTVVVGSFVFLAPKVEAQTVTPITSCSTITTPGNYELTGNITDTRPLPSSPFTKYNACIVVDTDNVVIEGNGFTITGPGGLGRSDSRLSGIDISTRSGVTVKKLKIEKFDTGIFLYFSNNNNLEQNTLRLNTLYGIALFSSSGNTVKNNISNLNGQIGIRTSFFNFSERGTPSNNNSFLNNTANANVIGFQISSFVSFPSAGNILDGNIAQSNSSVGLTIFSQKNMQAVNNTMSGNKFNFNFSGNESDDSQYITNVIDTTNTVDGKPIYYIVGATNQTFDSSTNAGTFYCSNCDNITVKDLSISKNNPAILLHRTTNSLIKNTSLTLNGKGIHLENNNSTNNIISENTITNNVDSGIYLRPTAVNTLVKDNIINSNSVGVQLEANNSILLHNTINGNTNYGVLLAFGSFSNTLKENTFQGNNFYGVFLSGSNNNQVYNNNFISNSPGQVNRASGTGNVFNIAVPIGGNYWNNYDAPSEGCNDTNSDNFCDLPYQKPSNSPGVTDNFPWTTQDGWIVPTDSTPPTITITTPTTDSILTSSSVTVTGTASDNIGVTSILVNGTPATLTSGSFPCTSCNWTATVSVTLPTTAGNSALNFTASASDAESNTSNPASVTVDNDGIDATIDTDDFTYSNTFTDGVTNGTVTTRNGWTLHVSDITTETPRSLSSGTYNVSENGVQVEVVAGSGTLYANISTCHTVPSSSSPETVLIRTNNVAGNVTCVTTGTGTNNTTMLFAMTASNSDLGLKKGFGSINWLTTAANQLGASGSPIFAGDNNTENLNWTVANDTTTFMTGLLTPGDAKDVTFTGTFESPTSISIKNLAGTQNIFTSDGDTTTLDPGETFTDQCPGISGNAGNTGCPFAKKVSVTMHNVNQSTKAVTQTPVVGAIVRVAKVPENTSTASLFNQMVDLYNAATIECTTNLQGITYCGLFSIEKYLPIAKIDNIYTTTPNFNANYGSDNISFDNLQVLSVTDKNNVTKLIPAKNTQVIGSLFNIYEPAMFEISNTTEYVPFVYQTENDYWTIVTNFTPPSNCTSDTGEFQASLNNETQAAIFTLTCDLSTLAEARQNIIAQASFGQSVKGLAKVSHVTTDFTEGGKGKKTNLVSQFAVSKARAPEKAKGKPFAAKKGGSLWSVAKATINNGVTDREVANRVKEVAQQYDIAIPEWGIAGKLDARRLSAALIESLFR